MERRRTFGWSLAGRLRTATALVAVLLVLVLSGDVLTHLGGSGLAAVEAPTSSAAGAPPQARLVAEPDDRALAPRRRPRRLRRPLALSRRDRPRRAAARAGGSSHVGGCRCPDGHHGCGPGGQADTRSQITSATPAPPEDKYLYEVNPGTANTGQPDRPPVCIAPPFWRSRRLRLPRRCR